MAKTKVTNIAEKRDANFKGFFTKIKIDKKSDVPELYYKNANDNYKNEIIVKGKSKALDSFLIAMQNLSTVFCEVCDIKDKTDDVTITTVNFSDKGGVIISGQIELNNGVPQPLCVNTPHIMIEAEKGYSLPDYAVSELEELKKEAFKYMRGDTAEKQGELFNVAAFG